MTGLKPNTRYYYKCGDGAGGFSQVFSFVSAPSQSQDFSIAIYGDMGVHTSEETTARVHDLVANQKIDWIYHIGDIRYD